MKPPSAVALGASIMLLVLGVGASLLFGQLSSQSKTLLRQSLAEECLVLIIPGLKTLFIVQIEIFLDINPPQL